jgi:hypothetical protein
MVNSGALPEDDRILIDPYNPNNQTTRHLRDRADTNGQSLYNGNDPERYDVSHGANGYNSELVFTNTNGNWFTGVFDGETYLINKVSVTLYEDIANIIGTYDYNYTVYTEGETETIAKTMGPVADGDTIDFVCDYYSYDGEYLDSYMLGEQLVVDGELMISDVYVDADAANLTYLFTDIYNQKYWSAPVTMY